MELVNLPRHKKSRQNPHPEQPSGILPLPRAKNIQPPLHLQRPGRLDSHAMAHATILVCRIRQAPARGKRVDKKPQRIRHTNERSLNSQEDTENLRPQRNCQQGMEAGNVRPIAASEMQDATKPKPTVPRITCSTYSTRHAGILHRSGGANLTSGG